MQSVAAGPASRPPKNVTTVSSRCERVEAWMNPLRNDVVAYEAGNKSG
jgi:hypothetical protein